MRVGRPKLTEGAARAAMFTLRLKPAERDAVEAAAQAAGLSASEWARKQLLAAAGVSTSAVELAGIEPAGTSGVGALSGPV